MLDFHLPNPEGPTVKRVRPAACEAGRRGRRGPDGVRLGHSPDTENPWPAVSVPHVATAEGAETQARCCLCLTPPPRLPGAARKHRKGLEGHLHVRAHSGPLQRSLRTEEPSSFLFESRTPHLDLRIATPTLALNQAASGAPVGHLHGSDVPSVLSVALLVPTTSTEGAQVQSGTSSTVRCQETSWR